MARNTFARRHSPTTIHAWRSMVPTLIVQCTYLLETLGEVIPMLIQTVPGLTKLFNGQK